MSNGIVSTMSVDVTMIGLEAEIRYFGVSLSLRLTL